MSCKVSVVVPVCNVEKYLRQCLDSICKQTLADIEIICVDDKSDDSSLEILREYQKKDQRFIVLENAARMGAAESRNRGIRIATGEYLSILDADDYFELTLLETAYKCSKETDADICGYDFWEFDNETGKCLRQCMQPIYYLQQEMQPGDVRVITNPEDCFRVFYGGGAWQKMYRKTFILANELLFQTLPNANDFYFSCITAALAERWVYIHRPLVWYRINRKGQTISKIDKYPLSLYIALSELYQGLLKKGRYLCLRQIFHAYAADMLFNIMRMFSTDEARNALFAHMEDDCFLSLGITRVRVEMFYYYRSYWYMKVLRSVQSAKSWLAVCDNESNYLYSRDSYFFEMLFAEKYTCALWGFGKMGKKWLERAARFRYSVFAIIDQDARKQGINIDNVCVIDFSVCPENVNAVIITNSRFRAAIADTVRASGRKIVIIDFDFFSSSSRLFGACVFDV